MEVACAYFFRKALTLKWAPLENFDVCDSLPNPLWRTKWFQKLHVPPPISYYTDANFVRKYHYLWFLPEFAKLSSKSSPSIFHSIQHGKDRQPFIDAPQDCATFHRAEYHKANKCSAVIHVYLLYSECVCSLSHAPYYIAICDLPDSAIFSNIFS
jgi:hypothetical protein